MVNFLAVEKEMDPSAWAAWIALAAAILSPVITILIDKVYQYHMKKLELNEQKRAAFAQLISDIVHAPTCGYDKKPSLSNEGAKALSYCNEQIVAAVMRYFSTWPSSPHTLGIMQEALYVFERPKGNTGYQQDTVQTATEKLIAMIKIESTKSLKQK